MSQIVDMTGDDLKVDAINVRGTDMTLSQFSGITAGTVAAGKAVVVDAGKDLTGGHNWTVTNMIVGTGGSFTGDSGTASATAGAATLNKMSGKITSEALTTAAGADYTLTITSSSIVPTCKVFASVDNGTNTTEGIAINRVTPGSGSVVIHVRNTHASAALNGTIVVSFFVVV